MSHSSSTVVKVQVNYLDDPLPRFQMVPIKMLNRKMNIFHDKTVRFALSFSSDSKLMFISRFELVSEMSTSKKEEKRSK